MQRTDITRRSTSRAHHLLRVDLGKTEISNLDDVILVVGQEKVFRLEKRRGREVRGEEGEKSVKEGNLVLMRLRRGVSRDY